MLNARPSVSINIFALYRPEVLETDPLLFNESLLCKAFLLALLLKVLLPLHLGFESAIGLFEFFLFLEKHGF